MHKRWGIGCGGHTECHTIDVVAIYVVQDLMCCRDVYGVALSVHKCMKIADAAALAAAKQQPR
jgi:hypothetical protein